MSVVSALCAALLILMSDARQVAAAGDFPGALPARTATLVFGVASPATGSFEVQLRLQLASVLRERHGGRVVKLRVFAVGAAALAQTRVVIAQQFAAAQAPLQVLALVGVAGFPDPGQQVALDWAVSGREGLAPLGVGWLPAWQHLRPRRASPGWTG
jgi:hypothetical protein